MATVAAGAGSLGAALRVVLILNLMYGGVALGLTHETQQIDAANTYRSVGVAMFLYQGSAAEPAICTGTLIHPRVVLTAAHCAMYFTPAPPPWIRTVMSFSPDNPRDPSTWIDITAHLVHPDFPWRNCKLIEPYGFGPCDTGIPVYSPGMIDVGLMLLARPITEIPVASLADIGDLVAAVGSSMTFVGYGCETPFYSHWDGWRNYGSAQLASVSDNTATYSIAPGAGCPGDSGGPTFRNGRVVAVFSDGDAVNSFRSRTDTETVRRWIADVISSLNSFDLNQHGLTGSWYEPVTSGQGLEVEIFPDLAGAGTAVVQVSWFTYDASVVGGPERQRWYTLGGKATSGAVSATLAVYQNVGGNFNAAPVTAATQVGNATLRFADCDHGTLDYTFSDGSSRAGTIDLTRLARNVTCATTGARPTNADFALSGNWYDRNTDGQGITVEINPLSTLAFFAWYTYVPNGTGLGTAGQRWYTGQTNGYVAGMRTVAMTRYETTRGRFDAPTTPEPTTVAVGTATLAFQSCTAATLTYNFIGGSSAGASGTIALTRVGPVPPGCAM